MSGNRQRKREIALVGEQVGVEAMHRDEKGGQREHEQQEQANPERHERETGEHAEQLPRASRRLVRGLPQAVARKPAYRSQKRHAQRRQM